MPDENARDGPAIEFAIEALKSKDLAGARALLGIDDAALSDDEFTRGMIAFEAAASLFGQGRHVEAHPHLPAAGVIAEHTDDGRTKEVFLVINGVVAGVSRMLAGDADGASRHFEEVTDYFEHQKFFDPDLERVALSTKAMYHLACSNRLLSAALTEEAEAEAGRATELHERNLKGLDPALEDNVGYFCEARLTRVELALAFASFDFSGLDLEQTGRRLDAAAQSAEDAVETVERMPDGPIKSVGRSILGAYRAFRSLHRVAGVLLVERSELTPELYRELQTTADLLFKADQDATEAGQRGQGARARIDVLRRLLRNLSEMARPRRRGFGKFAGLISLGSLVVLFGAVQVLAKPTGIYGLLYFFGALIVSLIAGFGFQALRFRPLLSMYADTLKLAKKTPPKEGE